MRIFGRLGFVVAVGVAGLFPGSSQGAAADETFRSHVVVCQQEDAAVAGRDVIRRGGNAIDAAVATAFALQVTHPAAGNIGGGGFIVAYLTASKEVVTVDFREMAPAAATERMYLTEDDKLIPHHRAGPLAAGVPGTVRGLGLAHAKYGKLPWADLVQPAVKLARDGFIITETLARSLNGQIFPRGQVDPTTVPEDLGPQGDRLADFAASVAAYRKPDSKPWEAGDRLIQPDLAATLEPDRHRRPRRVLYRGDRPENRQAHMKDLGGLVTMADLAAYQAKLRPPVHGTFKGFDVYGMGPVASGGILIVEMLNILERYDLKADGRQSPKTIHRVTEAMRRGFFTRATEIADPDFVDVPVAKLISKEYANTLAATITDQATPSASLAPFPIIGAEGTHTTHLSTLDDQGNAVAMTYTLEEGYGSKSVVAGAGFLLNNEMGDFNLIPGRTDTNGRVGTVPNRIAPRKRMLSSMSPTLILKDGKVRVVTGSPGGRTIPNTTLWVILNVLEFGLSPREAVSGLRTHHQWFPDTLALEGTWDDTTLEALKAMGYKVRTGGVQGDAHTIIIDEKGTIHGVPDLRRKTSRAAGD